jgi:hypothetical protein
MKNYTLLVVLFGAFTSAVSLAQQAKLIMVSAGSGLPEGVDFSVKPMGYEFGAKLTFFIEGEGLIGFKEDSLKSDGWKMDPFAKASEDGTQGHFSISKKGNFLGKLDSLKVTGLVDAIIGKAPVEKEAKVSTSAETTVGPFKLKLQIKKDDGWGNGVQITGPLDAIQKIIVKVDGKELESAGWGGFFNQRTYNFNGIKEGASVTVKYWSETKTVSYTFKS